MWSGLGVESHSHEQPAM